MFLIQTKILDKQNQETEFGFLIWISNSTVNLECGFRPLQRVETAESETRLVLNLNNSILSLDLPFWTYFILLYVTVTCNFGRVTLVLLQVQKQALYSLEM